jgi:hypothetical protein
MERLAGYGPLKVTLMSYAITAMFCLGALLAHTWYKTAGSAIVGLGILAFAVGLIALFGYGTSFWNSARVTAWRRVPAKEQV